MQRNHLNQNWKRTGLSMKSYKEMTRCVLEARDEHLKKKKRNQNIIRQCFPVAASICIIIIIGLGVWKKINYKPEIKNPSPSAEVTITKEETSVSSTEHKNIKESTVISSVTETSIIESAVSGLHPDLLTESDNNSVSSEISDIQTEANLKDITEKNSETDAVSADKENYEKDGCSDNHVYLHWNDMTVNQQYFLAEFGEPLLSYNTAEKEVSVSDIGEYICKVHMTGYDWYELNYHYCEAEAYRIKGDDEGLYIAIKFSNNEKFYQYTLQVPNNDDNMPDG